MLYLFLGIVILGCIAGAFELISQRFDGKEQPIRVQKGDCSTCSGDDSACEQVCMMQAATKDIVYFDDEELDIYRTAVLSSVESTCPTASKTNILLWFLRPGRHKDAHNETKYIYDFSVISYN